MTSLALEQSHIRLFLQEGICQIDGEAVFPGASEFVEFNDQIFLNTWKDQRIVPVPAYIPNAENILRMIRENLCDLDPVPFADMIDEIHSDIPSVFKWVMHWLSALYQQPGYAIGTALWFIDPRGGVGKGTLLSTMARLLGERYVGKLNEDEMGKGWSPFSGKLLIEGDEFDIGDRKKLADKFKLWIGNKNIDDNKRYLGANQIPTMVNFLMTTNRENPIYLDRTDRRHTLIKTSYSPNAKPLAKSVAQLLYSRNPQDQSAKEEMLQGFAAILGMTNIDFAWIL